MRAALWLLSLFAVAVAVALFAGNNQGTVTLYWPPYRIDLSLNLVLLLLAGSFAIWHAALRALAALLELPRQARRWRQQQKERAMHGALLDALTHMLGGRFLRARKTAAAALAQEQALAASGAAATPHARQLRALAHMIAAESSHALQDRALRESHWHRALQQTPAGGSANEQELREGIQMRAAHWSLDERDPDAALERLAALSQGAARRTLALRIKLRAARLARQTQEALDTARLLGKHRAFSPDAAQSLVRSLATELIHGARDSAQLQQIWQGLESAERQMPELAIHAARQLAALGGAASQVRAWLLPVWERMLEQPGALTDQHALMLVQTLEAAGLDALDAAWLARIESAQQAQPRDARLQYLAGMACLKHQLWGKSQQLLTQASQQLTDASLRASAWRHLAELAEQRGDDSAAASAWKKAAGKAIVLLCHK
ncbi:heme biosynthesis protein HemY [Verminephrobacter eiseniae]|uniref:heme biosynthesis protein HemY n=1 Tax=Verminephrobacter eiseniae TaxID=364317 RepID=UPI00223739E6|nr:heme biosynthesis HemY N-terminal domain-containing protein [Verminephrobacter eiseniae]MCW5233884.1 heme biosynthesis protein HemY [Verminephrobacter eiseniae]MCW5294561.1 heme biosynthesis protein HemY [Verminephrobacter eiseniae]MCW8184880.1 heme biosynthesis protein HemY [Verminephrobacter eiseniae]MCW8223626.1 heme biosynthesis protein HemY [Verminephrobacter eiseniae]MCW8234674.1 heme biosynthesis protein HemY [Verminephrobacter eiseniae]